MISGCDEELTASPSMAAKGRLDPRVRDRAAADERIDQGAMQRGRVGHPASASGQKLEEVGRQVVELSAAGLAAEVALDSSAQPVVRGLAQERRDLPLGLR